jgi:hypothetical protein
MWNLLGSSFSRRAFLQVGTVGVGGLALGQGLATAARGATAASGGKSVIFIYLPGGPSHIDMFDMKPNAPVEIRGEFSPIRSKVPGLEVCELLPKLSQTADKYTVLRGFQTTGSHDGTDLTTGFSKATHRPAFGSVVSRLSAKSGPTQIPPYVTLVEESNLPFGQDPAYLGVAHRPFAFRGPDMENLVLPKGLPRDRFDDRAALRRQFDNLNRARDYRGEMAGVDVFTERALEIVTSPQVRDAFDVSREPQAVRARYGTDPASTHFLRARRLIEAGAKVVTLCGGWVSNGESPANLSNWDTHDENFPRMREQLPHFDRALSALIGDLFDRGLDREVVVVACGEMGRSPRVGVPNPGSNATSTGRDHWPTGFCLVSGGGLAMGQIVGETDRRGERSTGRPITIQNLLATLYHVVGIDAGTTLLDSLNRPQTLLDDRAKIAALL